MVMVVTRYELYVAGLNHFIGFESEVVWNKKSLRDGLVEACFAGVHDASSSTGR